MEMPVAEGLALDREDSSMASSSAFEILEAETAGKTGRSAPRGNNILRG